MNEFLGEIRAVGFDYVPLGWGACNGDLLPIAENLDLYQMIGITYGGNGTTNFALPDLRGRAALCSGINATSAYALGQSGGSETEVLTVQQMPSHGHGIAAQSAMGTQASPQGNYFAASGEKQFGTVEGTATTAPLLVAQGGNQPHENLMPFLCVRYIISLTGAVPAPPPDPPPAPSPTISCQGDSIPYVGQISVFSFGQVIPVCFTPCNGQLRSIVGNEILFQVLGTRFGGDGVTNFALPNLVGRFPLGMATGGNIGGAGGEESHTLETYELPVHLHGVAASSEPANLTGALENNYPAMPAGNLYETTADTTLGTGSSAAGGSQPHPNMPPYLALNYCIATMGIILTPPQQA